MKSVFFKIFCLFLLTFMAYGLQSQVRINVEIENYDDSLFYLMKYKSNDTFISIGKSSISSKRKVFKNKDNYEEGIYLLADSRYNPIFEIFIGKDQKFSLHVEELMDLNAYKVKGSKETSKYFEINSKISYNRLHIKALESEMEYFPDNARKIDSIKSMQNEYLESIKIKNLNSFLVTCISLNKEVVVPQEYKDNSEQYIIDHYFDNMRFDDIRILNTRLLKNKLDDYFGNYISKRTPEVICQKIDDLVNKINDTESSIRDYILWYLYSKYFNPEDVRNELVYICLIDNYFSRLEIENVTENIRNEMKKRADVLRKITIGQTAPALSYIDDNGNEISLEDVDSKYTVLFFYKPDCQRCIRDKRILELVRKRRDDIVVLSINISEDNYKNVSRNIINQYDIMTTPTIYLLDENKEIIAKHIESEEVEFHIIKR